MKHAGRLPLWSSVSARVQLLNPQYPSASFHMGVMGFPPGADPFSEQAGRTGHCGQLWPRGPSHLPTQPAAAEADVVLDLTHKGEPLVSTRHSPNPKDPIPEGRGSQYQRHSPCRSGLWGLGRLLHVLSTGRQAQTCLLCRLRGQLKTYTQKLKQPPSRMRLTAPESNSVSPQMTAPWAGAPLVTETPLESAQPWPPGFSE